MRNYFIKEGATVFVGKKNKQGELTREMTVMNENTTFTSEDLIFDLESQKAIDEQRFAKFGYYGFNIPEGSDYDGHILLIHLNHVN